MTHVTRTKAASSRGSVHRYYRQWRRRKHTHTHTLWPPSYRYSFMPSHAFAAEPSNAGSQTRRQAALASVSASVNFVAGEDQNTHGGPGAGSHKTHPERERETPAAAAWLITLTSAVRHFGPHVSPGSLSGPQAKMWHSRGVAGCGLMGRRSCAGKRQTFVPWGPRATASWPCVPCPVPRLLAAWPPRVSVFGICLCCQQKFL